MKRRITNTAARTIRCPTDKREIFVRDTELRGFGMRVSRNVTSFIYETSSGGKSKRVTIGQWPAWDADLARQNAAERRQKADAGVPVTTKHKTMAHVWERHLKTGYPTLSKSERINRKRHVERDILPAIGNIPLSAVTFADCEDIHASVVKPYEANRSLDTLHRLFALAIRWGWCDKNPAKGVERHREHPRNDYFTPAQIETIFATLPETGPGDLIRLMLLTGCRPGEARAMAWTQLDLEAGRWVKPHTNTKQRREHRVPLSDAAIALIRRQPVRGPLVFTQANGRPVGTLWYVWTATLQRTGIPHIRLYTCRHSVASMIASRGMSLQVIRDVLGHSSIATTERYAHLYDEEVRKAVDIVSLPGNRKSR